MIKTFVYIGKDSTRVKVKKNEAKVTVEPNGTIQSELELQKNKNFVLVGAESIEMITTKIGESETRKKEIKSREKYLKDQVTAQYEVQLESISEQIKVDCDIEDKKIAFLKAQKDAAYSGIGSKIKELEDQKKALDGEKKLYETMDKNVTQKKSK